MDYRVKIGRLLMLLAAAGSVAALAAAFAFQFIGGLAPCHLCLLQRWPHGVAIGIGMVALAVSHPPRFLALLGAVAAAASAVIGVYHTGVERGWWEGPSTCTGGDVTGVSTGDLLNQIMAAPLIRCDEVAWSMLGLSMASWNAVLSFGLAAIWLTAWAKMRA